MEPAQAIIDLELIRGATLDEEFIVYADDGCGNEGDPINWTGYTGECDFRETVASVTPFLQCTTANGRMILSANGSIRLLVPAATMAAITQTTGVYEIKLSSGGVVVKPIRGAVTITQSVTP